MSGGEPTVIRDHVDELLQLVRPIRRGIVSIDGCAGCGKTSLMRELASSLRCGTIDLDHFIKRKRGRFMRALRLNELRTALERADTELVLLAGVCAIEALNEVGRSAELSVYVQRISKSGVPGDQPIIDAEEEGSDEPLQPDLPGALDRELKSYHARFRPRRSADVVFYRTEA